MTTDPEKPKIFVDEDWKSQVQAEKEAAKAAPASAPSTSTDAVAPASTGGSSADSTIPAKEMPEQELPPASLFFLCTTIATQAMIALGEVPNPITGKTEVRLKQAKHYIDTLSMLEQKTVGNRTPDESTLFDDLLHQLRMAFVMQNV